MTFHISKVTLCGVAPLGRWVVHCVTGAVATGRNCWHSKMTSSFLVAFFSHQAWPIGPASIMWYKHPNESVHVLKMKIGHVEFYRTY